MRREQATAVLAGTVLSLAAWVTFVIAPIAFVLGCWRVGAWLA